MKTKAKKKSTKLSTKPVKAVENTKRGRPSKYQPEYCEEMVKFFSIKPTHEVDVTTTYKNGIEVYKTEERANPLPTFSRFAHQIGVNVDTLKEWAHKHEDFSAAYKKSKELQKDFLIECGLKGIYNATFAIFTAKNITDMRDQVEQVHDIGPNFIELYRNLPQPKVVEMIHRASKELKGENDKTS